MSCVCDFLHLGVVCLAAGLAVCLAALVMEAEGARLVIPKPAAVVVLATALVA